MAYEKRNQSLFVNTPIFAGARGFNSNTRQILREKGGCKQSRAVLAIGRPLKADHPSAICFLDSVYMQKVPGPSARIFLSRDRIFLARR